MAEVFLGLSAGPGGFNKLVVLKRIRPQLAEDPDFLRMFLDEARLAARLNHPNIVQTNEIGCDDEQYFMAMEYLEGQPLNRVRNRLKRQPGAFTLCMHLRIVCDVLSGLHYAHELTDYDGTPLGVVHRDASPHNTFITYAGQVKLMDFGIAKAMNSTSETRAGMLKGKVPYMAPEQARGDGVDRRADIFSVGVMIWEALAGRRLWQDRPDVAVLKWLVDEAPSALPSPRQFNPDVPAILEAICMRAVSPQRTLRQATALELRHELEHALASLPDQHRVRDAGPLVAQFFADERSRIRRLVEQQVSRVRALGAESFARVSIPQLGPATVSGTPSGAAGYTPSAPSQGGYTPSAPSHGGFTPSSPSQGGLSSSMPSAPQHSGVMPSPSRPVASDRGIVPTESQDELSIQTEPRSVQVSAPPVISQPPMTTSSMTPAPGAIADPSTLSIRGGRSSSTWWMLGAAGVIAIVVGVVSGAAALWSTEADWPALPASSSPPEQPATASSTSETSAAPSPSTAVADERVRVQVRASPDHAEIRIDGRKVSGNPYDGMVDRDDEEHEIRVEATGHEPIRRTVSFDRAVDLTLELEPTRSGRAPVRYPRPQPKPKPEPEPEPEPPPATTGPTEDDDWMTKRWPKSKRPIDEDNPYRK
jgi:serine/threonine-protein kinase